MGFFFLPRFLIFQFPRRLLLLTAGCALLAGCIVVPVRTPKAVQGPTGRIKKLDMKFLAPGSTSRAEVLDKLGAINAAPGFDHFLWARWKQSTWAVAWAVSAGYGTGAGDINRLWGSENLLVVFDADGKVKEYRRVSEGHLTRELRALLKNEPPMAPTEEVIIAAEHRHFRTDFGDVKILLTPTAIQFREARKPAHSFDISPDAITSMDSALHDNGKNKFMEVEQTIHFRSRTPVGNKVSLRMDTRDYLAMLRYMNQYCPKMR